MTNASRKERHALTTADCIPGNKCSPQSKPTCPLKQYQRVLEDKCNQQNPLITSWELSKIDRRIQTYPCAEATENSEQQFDRCGIEELDEVNAF